MLFAAAFLEFFTRIGIKLAVFQFAGISKLFDLLKITHSSITFILIIDHIIFMHRNGQICCCCRVWGFGFFVFSELGKKDFSSATTMTTAGMLPLLVVEVGTGTAERLGSACHISQDDHHHQW